MTLAALTAAAVALAVVARKELTDLVRARYSVVYIVTHEEARVEAEIAAVAQARSVTFQVWGCSQGWLDAEGAGDGATDPIQALARVLQSKERGVYVLRDFHAFLDDTSVKRWVRDLAVALRPEGKTIVILAPTMKLPAELEKDVAVLDWPLPDREELGMLFDGMVAQLKNGKRASALALKPAIVEAALGLTTTEAENALARGLVQAEGLDPKAILRAKKDVIRKAGVLEYQEASASLDDVGGLDELKGWLVRRRKAFAPEAKAFGIDTPKGVLVVGVPGTGKTLTAKAISAAWGMPLLRMDMSKLLGSLVGESEGKLAQAIKTAEAVAPCVLLVDEVEKAMAGAGSDSSGVSTRMLGMLLQWMAEKTAPVYVVMTANDVSSLPPEFLRKGRLDEIWFVDLPDHAAREEIFGTHLKRRGHELEILDYATLADATEGFVGAELEQAVVEGLCTAFYEERKVVTGDILAAIQATVPLSTMMKERIDALRAWAKGRARLAAKPRKAARSTTTRVLDTEDFDA